jgi:hypothetical protein
LSPAATCIVGSAVADDEAVDCADDCNWPLSAGAGSCVEEDCAWAKVDGKNAASSTAASDATARQHGLAKMSLTETGKGRSFDWQNLMMLSVQ